MAKGDDAEARDAKPDLAKAFDEASFEGEDVVLGGSEASVFVILEARGIIVEEIYEYQLRRRR